MATAQSVQRGCECFWKNIGGGVCGVALGLWDQCQQHINAQTVKRIRYQSMCQHSTPSTTPPSLYLSVCYRWGMWGRECTSVGEGLNCFQDTDGTSCRSWNNSNIFHINYYLISCAHAGAEERLEQAPCCFQLRFALLLSQFFSPTHSKVRQTAEGWHEQNGARMPQLLIAIF